MNRTRYGFEISWFHPRIVRPLPLLQVFLFIMKLMWSSVPHKTINSHVGFPPQYWVANHSINLSWFINFRFVHSVDCSKLRTFSLFSYNWKYRTEFISYISETVTHTQNIRCCILLELMYHYILMWESMCVDYRFYLMPTNEKSVLSFVEIALHDGLLRTYCHIFCHWYKNFSQECNKIGLALFFVVCVVFWNWWRWRMMCPIYFALFPNSTRNSSIVVVVVVCSPLCSIFCR